MAATDGVVPSTSKLWAVRKYSYREPLISFDPLFPFCEASKEWVIPAKPKPGRKPKKDTNEPVKEEKVCLFSSPSQPLF
jgi:hypothetical protein